MTYRSIHIAVVAVLGLALAATALPPAEAAHHRPGRLLAADATYDPRKVEWKAVVAACKAIATYEKRMAGFIIRAGYHDAMAVNITCTKASPTPVPITLCGGADGSALLSAEEQRRNESRHRSYLERASRAVAAIAAKYGASVADTLAVCAMSVPEVLGAADLLRSTPLKVGRIDSAAANPPGSLLAAEADLPELERYWNDRGMTLAEGVALLGAHALMEGKGCVKARAGRKVALALAAQEAGAGGGGGGGRRRRLLNTEAKGDGVATCNPFGEDVADPVGPDGSSIAPGASGSCPGLQMHRMDNQFFVDLFTPNVTITDVRVRFP